MSTIAVVGAGRMGVGIAVTFLAAGHDVILVDIKPRSEEQAHAHRAVVSGLLAEAPRAATLAGRDADLSGISVVFEAVPETVEAKQDALDWIAANTDSSVVIASTTSGFLVTEIAAMAAKPGQVVNSHWLNPAHLIPLVEVSASEETDPDAVARVIAVLEGVGKIPVMCAPSAGYIVPRLQALVMNEAARMVEEGVATAAEIDRAVRAGFGPRFSVLGPLEFIDWGGGDILCQVSRYLAIQHGDRFTAPATVERNQLENRRGLRDGVGFYDYVDDPDAIAAYRKARLREFEEIFALRTPKLRSGTPVPTRGGGAT